MKHNYLSLSALALVCITCASTTNAQTKFEWESADAAKSIVSPISFNGVNKDMDFFGNLSHNHFSDFVNSDLGWTFSNGAAHCAWSGAATEFMFAGTGVTVRCLKYDDAAQFTWSILNAAGTPVATGTEDLKAAAADYDFVAAAAGTLPYGLYKLKLESTGTGSVIVDYATVNENGIKRAEETSNYVVREGAWSDGDQNGAPSGGAMIWTRNSGDKLTVNFKGKDIAVVGPYSKTWFGGLGKVDWSIDNGAKSGTINFDNAKFADFPDSRIGAILASDLDANANHTLTLTVSPDNANKVVLIDAFDTSGYFISPNIEIEQTNSPISFNGVNKDVDFVGILSTNHIGNDFSNADLGWVFSNGYTRVVTDNWSPSAALDLNFCGSKVTARLLRYGNGTPNVKWQLLGENGTIVNEGEISLDGNAANVDLEVTPAQAGLWTLRLKAAGNTGKLMLADFFKVEDNKMARVEAENDLVVKSAEWLKLDTDSSYLNKPSADYWMSASAANATMVVDFEGTDIAIVTPANVNYGVVAWDIDAGAKTGMIDLADSYFAPADFTDMRSSHIIAKGLADGHHKLKLTTNSEKGVFIDAFDTNGKFIVSPDPAAVTDWSLF